MKAAREWEPIASGGVSSKERTVGGSDAQIHGFGISVDLVRAGMRLVASAAGKNESESRKGACGGERAARSHSSQSEGARRRRGIYSGKAAHPPRGALQERRGLLRASRPRARQPGGLD